MNIIINNHYIIFSIRLKKDSSLQIKMSNQETIAKLEGNTFYHSTMSVMAIAACSGLVALANAIGTPFKGFPPYIAHAWDAQDHAKEEGRNDMSLLHRVIHPTDWAMEILLEENNLDVSVLDFYKNLGMPRRRISIMRFKQTLESLQAENYNEKIEELTKKRDEYTERKPLTSILMATELMFSATLGREPLFYEPSEITSKGVLLSRNCPPRYIPEEFKDLPPRVFKKVN